jgi:hypothetical protein
MGVSGVIDMSVDRANPYPSPPRRPAVFYAILTEMVHSVPKRRSLWLRNVYGCGRSRN